jgi:trigger factor
VEVRPEVIAAGYGGLDIEKPMRSVTEADVDRFLEELRQSFAQLRPVPDRTRAAAGDLATIDYEARVGGRVAGKGEKRLVAVADGEEEFSKRLEGAEVGSTIEFEIDYPAEHSNHDLAGKRVSFRVVVRSLSTKEVPALDDEFAKDHGEVDTLEQLRERVRQRLEAEAAHDAERAARNAAVAELVRLHEIEVPQAMASRRAETLAEQFLDSLGSRRPAASREGDVRRQLAADLMPRAIEQVKAELILAAIASQENLQIDDTIVDEQIDRLAARAGAAGERVRALYQDPSARASLRASLLEERALDLVMERAQVRPVEISGIAEAEGNG